MLTENINGFRFNHPINGDRIAFCLMTKCLTLFAVMLLSSLTVRADEQDTVNVIAGLSRTLDDNFFRKSSPTVSEIITSAYVTLSVDKQISMQRLKFDYTINNLSYQNYSTLNSTMNNYNAAWQFAITPRLMGSISTQKSEVQYGFLDATFTGKPQIGTSEVQNFVADWAPQGSLHFLAGFTRTLSLNSANFQPDRGNTTNAIDWGVKYAFPSGSDITLMEHYRKGRFANISFGLPQSFSENESEAKLNWLISAKSSVNLRLGFVERMHDQENGVDFSSRDYADWVGDASANWAPTAKIKISISAESGIGVYQTANANYARNNSLSFNSVYAGTNKILVRGIASISERVIEGGSNETDTIESESLGLDWTPRRYVTIGAKLQRMSRSSSVVNRNFIDISSIFTANVNF